MRHEMQTIGSYAALGVLLAACARDSVSLGEEGQGQLAPGDSACAAVRSVDRDVRVRDQAELDALAGCEEIGGSLVIDFIPGLDLRPLASLRAVGGDLDIGTDSSVLSWEEMSVEASWPASLEGLEALERVGALHLTRIAVPDLSALSSLRFVNAAVAQTITRPGYLSIAYAKNLADLRGLERVNGIATLQLFEMPALESLDGVVLDTRIDAIDIQKAPRLEDIGALAAVSRSEYVVFGETGLEDLWALSELEFAGSFNIIANPSLIEASSIPSPSTELFRVSDNPRLRGSLELFDLRGPSFIDVSGNERLEGVTFNHGEVLSFPLEGGNVNVSRNASLQNIAIPNGWDQLESFEIRENPSLVHVAFGRLSQLDELHIVNNSSLTTLDHSEFEHIYVIDVVDNPQLSVASLAQIPAFTRSIEGNADAPAPSPSPAP